MGGGGGGLPWIQMTDALYITLKVAQNVLLMPSLHLACNDLMAPI